MRTTRLETLVSLATIRCHSCRGPQMNKFEQVSSDHHHMSLAGELGVSGLMSRGAVLGEPQVWCLEGGRPGEPAQWDPIHHG